MSLDPICALTARPGGCFSRKPLHCTQLVVVHAGVVTVPPRVASSDRSLAAQPLATPIAIAIGVAGPPTDSDADKAVVKVAMVVIGEVVVVVTMHVVAMPIITVPRGATMPAISIQSTHTGVRSEERRVGKECSTWWTPAH